MALTPVVRDNPPPVPNLPFGILTATGEVMLTPPAFGFLQDLWASLQRVGGIVAALPAVLSTLVLNEVPVGAIDGVNLTFTVANLPTATGVALFVNGLMQAPGINYTLAGSTITMITVPLPGDVLLVNYGY